jgi:Domain of unknown function (DUF4234)
MTDSTDARAHPPEPERPEAERAPDSPAPAPSPSTAPAAHAHPARAGTAVLEGRRASGGPAAVAPSAWSSAEATPEPPPFGFNAPKASSPGRGGIQAPSLQPATPAPPAPSVPNGQTAPFGTGQPRWSSGARHAALAASAAATAPGASAPGAPVIGSVPAAPAPTTTPPRELMPAAAVMAPARRLGEVSTPSFGPPGRSRSVAAMIAFSVLTLGIYALVWHRRVNQEMVDFDPRVHTHPSRSAWAVVLPWLIGLGASAAAGARILADHLAVSLPHLPITAAQATPGLAAIAAVPYLVLLIPFSVVALVLTAERVRLVEEHAGVTTDEQIRPASLPAWLLFPLIGGFVVMGRQQRALNRIWDLARG